MKESEAAADRGSALLLLLVGTALVYSFKLIGETYFDGFVFDLGSPGVPSALYIGFLALWSFFGLCAATAFTLGFVLLANLRKGGSVAKSLLPEYSDLRWIAVSAILAFLIPLGIRLFVLDGAPLTDDESAYRFSAQLLAQGRLVADSPPEKLFFDRSFMINDGRFYSQYFLGWPALMVPFLWLGLPGLANAFISGLTVPGVFLVARRFAGGGAARLATLLYLGSPFLMVAAATELSHTSCLGALVWMTWATQRSRDEDSNSAVAAWVGLFFCVAFFIRPLTALSLGLPLMAWWGLGVLRRQERERWRVVVAFAIPCVLLGGLFLEVNVLQNGSATRSAYSAALDYARDNDFRFTHFDEDTTLSVPLDPTRLKIGIANAGVALFRLNGAMFGWPISFLLVPLAWRAKQSGVLWTGIAAFMLFHLTMLNVGIDSFGPVHYLELTWPTILLSSIGVTRLTEHLAARPAAGGIDWACAPAILVLVLVGLGLTCYVPPRFGALRSMTTVINRALRTPENYGLSNAIVFAPRFLTRNCELPAPQSFVQWRPNPDPSLEDNILWVNHITIDDDRRLMRHFPDRQGFVFGWARGCKGALLALDDPRADTIPPGPS